MRWRRPSTPVLRRAVVAGSVVEVVGRGRAVRRRAGRRASPRRRCRRAPGRWPPAGRSGAALNRQTISTSGTDRNDPASTRSPSTWSRATRNTFSGGRSCTSSRTSVPQVWLMIRPRALTPDGTPVSARSSVGTTFCSGSASWRAPAPASAPTAAATPPTRSAPPPRPKPRSRVAGPWVGPPATARPAHAGAATRSAGGSRSSSYPSARPNSASSSSSSRSIPSATSYSFIAPAPRTPRAAAPAPGTAPSAPHPDAVP